MEGDRGDAPGVPGGGGGSGKRSTAQRPPTDVSADEYAHQRPRVDPILGPQPTARVLPERHDVEHVLELVRRVDEVVLGGAKVSAAMRARLERVKEAAESLRGVSSCAHERTVCVVGARGVGKSFACNQLIGLNVLPSEQGHEGVTRAPTVVRANDKDDDHAFHVFRVRDAGDGGVLPPGEEVLCMQPGQPLGSAVAAVRTQVSVLQSNRGADHTAVIEVHVPQSHFCGASTLARRIRFVDMPGWGDDDAVSEHVRRALRTCDVLVQAGHRGVAAEELVQVIQHGTLVKRRPLVLMTTRYSGSVSSFDKSHALTGSELNRAVFLPQVDAGMVASDCSVAERKQFFRDVSDTSCSLAMSPACLPADLREHVLDYLDLALCASEYRRLCSELLSFFMAARASATRKDAAELGKLTRLVACMRAPANPVEDDRYARGGSVFGSWFAQAELSQHAPKDEKLDEFASAVEDVDGTEIAATLDLCAQYVGKKCHRAFCAVRSASSSLLPLLSADVESKLKELGTRDWSDATRDLQRMRDHGLGTKCVHELMKRVIQHADSIVHPALRSLQQALGARASSEELRSAGDYRTILELFRDHDVNTVRAHAGAFIETSDAQRTDDSVRPCVPPPSTTDVVDFVRATRGFSEGSDTASTMWSRVCADVCGLREGNDGADVVATDASVLPELQRVARQGSPVPLIDLTKPGRANVSRVANEVLRRLATECTNDRDGEVIVPVVQMVAAGKRGDGADVVYPDVNLLENSRGVVLWVVPQDGAQAALDFIAAATSTPCNHAAAGGAVAAGAAAGAACARSGERPKIVVAVVAADASADTALCQIAEVVDSYRFAAFWVLPDAALPIASELVPVVFRTRHRSLSMALRHAQAPLTLLNAAVRKAIVDHVHTMFEKADSQVLYALGMANLADANALRSAPECIGTVIDNLRESLADVAPVIASVERFAALTLQVPGFLLRSAGMDETRRGWSTRITAKGIGRSVLFNVAAIRSAVSSTLAAQASDPMPRSGVEFRDACIKAVKALAAKVHAQLDGRAVFARITNWQWEKRRNAYPK